MHSVCVCQFHQNSKLLVAAIPQENDYRELLNKMVCDFDNRECMLHMCPGKDGLCKYLLDVFNANEDEPEDLITFKQWVQTDHTTLVTLQLPLQEFITKICSTFHELRHNHFIAKAQAKFLTNLKNNLPENAAVILLDFAEKYSFVIQDAVQGHHWDNSQATIHPFVVYHKDGSDIVTSSFCVISDSLKHDTVSVHAFITTLLNHMKTHNPQIQKVFYFSDWAASQYKDLKKNFKSL